MTIKEFEKSVNGYLLKECYIICLIDNFSHKEIFSGSNYALMLYDEYNYLLTSYNIIRHNIVHNYDYDILNLYVKRKVKK